MELVISDFDGTLADTFQPSPSGIGVTEAYERAIKSILGAKGKYLYQQIGGLRNRSPGEVIRAILAAAKHDRQEIVSDAKNYYEKQGGRLLGLVPRGKGTELNWTDSEPDDVITEMLVREKLSILMNEIGPEWPRPFAGVVSFLKQYEQLSIEFAILSSGHQVFIEKVFDAWGIRHPAMVTDDDLRGKTPYLSKPDAALMDLVLERMPGTTPAIYLGDDPKKDGEFAVNAGIPFGWFNPSERTSVGTLPKGTLQFRSWNDLDKYLHSVQC